MPRKQDEGGNPLAETRRQAILEQLGERGSITVAEVQARFGVSPITARRDLSQLAERGEARRTHGGAIRPGAHAHEDAFARRLSAHVPEKRCLAVAAVTALAPNPTIFLDSSTTSYFVARCLAERGLAATVLTNSLPIANLLFERSPPSIGVVMVGGTLRRVNRSFVGPLAVQSVREHFPDHLFFSVKALTADGTLTEADPLEAEVKQAMMAQAGETILLVDRSKLTARGLVAIAPVQSVTRVETVDLTDGELRRLRTLGARVQNRRRTDVSLD
ncbi:MAG: DeoR/GlpR transcriptional regulator [Solirubrobacterales bacterium]|nr:DeoR/GlpR transcriptional regulator [Solirubrobacterales bacterium]